MPRIEAVVDKGDGDVELVNIGRPAALIAFADEFGKMAPESYRELAWLAHRALRIEQPLEEWLETLDDLDSGTRVAEVKLEQRGKLEAPELLESLSAAELVDLATTEPSRDGIAVGRTSRLDELVHDAARTLERRTKEAERDRQVAERNAEIDRRQAADELEKLTAADLEAMPADQLAELKRRAGVSVGETPTTPAPALAGVGE